MNVDKPKQLLTARETLRRVKASGRRFWTGLRGGLFQPDAIAGKVQLFEPRRVPEIREQLKDKSMSGIIVANARIHDLQRQLGVPVDWKLGGNIVDANQKIAELEAKLNTRTAATNHGAEAAVERARLAKSASATSVTATNVTAEQILAAHTMVFDQADRTAARQRAHEGGSSESKELLRDFLAAGIDLPGVDFAASGVTASSQKYLHPKTLEAAAKNVPLFFATIRGETISASDHNSIGAEVGRRFLQSQKTKKR